MKKAQRTADFVVCINNADYPASLERQKIYRVVPDLDAEDDGDIRIVDESGEDYLYPSSHFAPIKVPSAVEKSLLRASSSPPSTNQNRDTSVRSYCADSSTGVSSSG